MHCSATAAATAPQNLVGTAVTRAQRPARQVLAVHWYLAVIPTAGSSSILQWSYYWYGVVDQTRKKTPHNKRGIISEAAQPASSYIARASTSPATGTSVSRTSTNKSFKIIPRRNSCKARARRVQGRAKWTFNLWCRTYVRWLYPHVGIMSISGKIPRGKRQKTKTPTKSNQTKIWNQNQSLRPNRLAGRAAAVLRSYGWVHGSTSAAERRPRASREGVTLTGRYNDEEAHQTTSRQKRKKEKEKRDLGGGGPTEPKEKKQKICLLSSRGPFKGYYYPSPPEAACFVCLFVWFREKTGRKKKAIAVQNSFAVVTDALKSWRAKPAKNQ